MQAADCCKRYTYPAQDFSSRMEPEVVRYGLIILEKQFSILSNGTAEYFRDF